MVRKYLTHCNKERIFSKNFLEQNYIIHLNKYLVREIFFFQIYYYSLQLINLYFLNITAKYFCTNNTNLNWTEAKDFCRKGFPVGRLAVDTSSDTNRVLVELMKKNNITEAWLGASTKPMYWNWTPSKHGTIDIALTYQY